MPTYDYLCKSCRKVREVTKPITRATDEERCYECGSPMNLTFTSPPAIQFRGDGWAGKSHGKS